MLGIPEAVAALLSIVNRILGMFEKSPEQKAEERAKKAAKERAKRKKEKQDAIREAKRGNSSALERFLRGGG